MSAMRDTGHDPRSAVLRTKRLVLDRPRADDADAITAAMTDWDVVCMLARVPLPYDRKAAVDWLAGVESPDNDNPIFAIRHGEEPAFVGIVAIYRGEAGDRVGYWLAKPWWGKGLMTEALDAVLGWYFTLYPDATLKSGVFADNGASLRVQQKLGFRVTGTSEIYSMPRSKLVTHIDTTIGKRDRAA